MTARILLAARAAFPPPNLADVGGPLRLRTDFPSPPPLDLDSAVAESGAHPATTYHYVDTETARLDLRYTVPFGRRWSLEAGAPLMMHAAGLLGASIEACHGALGFRQAQHDKAPQYFGQGFPSPGGSCLAFRAQLGPALADVALRGLHLLPPPPTAPPRRRGSTRDGAMS